MWKVYLIKTENNLVYIGCTKLEMRKRFAVHKYQKKEFVLKPHTLEIVAKFDNYQDARKFEIELIKEYDATNPQKGYNRRFGDHYSDFPDYVHELRNKTNQKRGSNLGEKNHMFGKKHSLETREKIRQKALARHPDTFEKNRHKTPEHIQKLVATLKEYQKSNPHPRLGKRHSEESKKKMSETKRLKNSLSKK